MQTLTGRFMGMKLKEGDPEKNPLGDLTIIFECRGSEDAIIAYNRLRGQDVIIVSAQEGLFDGKKEQ